jgi:4'-phosphopantetheinyl transferase
MPLFKTITQTEGIIGVWQLSETLDELLPFFSDQELKDPVYLQYTHEKRKIEWLATRSLIKLLIGPDFTISYAESGKPILKHTRYGNISISHSRYFAAVYIHEKLHVGLDIEDSARNYNSIEKRYLSDEELLQTGKNPLLQCLYWCAKEAIFKLVPDQDIEFRNQIHISLFNPEVEDHFPVKFKSGKGDSIHELYFEVFNGHCMVWVASEISSL